MRDEVIAPIFGPVVAHEFESPHEHIRQNAQP